jgi:hypothetical protein
MMSEAPGAGHGDLAALMQSPVGDHRTTLLLWIAVLALLGGCRLEPIEWPGVDFPPADELWRIVAKPAEAGVNSAAADPVPRWTLDGPLPDHVGRGPAFGDSPGERLLAELAADPEFTASEPLTCAARQLARFYAEHGAPRRLLLDFMVHRCGATTPSPRRLATPAITRPSASTCSV